MSVWFCVNVMSIVFEVDSMFIFIWIDWMGEFDLFNDLLGILVGLSILFLLVGDCKYVRKEMNVVWVLFVCIGLVNIMLEFVYELIYLFFVVVVMKFDFEWGMVLFGFWINFILVRFDIGLLMDIGLFLIKLSFEEDDEDEVCWGVCVCWVLFLFYCCKVVVCWFIIIM